MVDSLGRPEFVEELHETVVDHESDSDVQADTTQSGNGTFVEPRTNQEKQLRGKGRSRGHSQVQPVRQAQQRWDEM